MAAKKRPAAKKINNENQMLANASIGNIPEPLARTNLATATNNYLTYRDIVPDITVKNPYSENDYYNFREGEKLPTTPKGIMSMGMKYYKTNPIVKNTIDMMAELSANGMFVSHRSKRIQDFYNNYLQKIDSYSINEQFVRWLLKAGATVVNRSFTKVTKAVLADMQVGLAADQEFPKITYTKSEIPIGYSFLNPLYVNVPQEDIAMFMGKVKYFLALPKTLVDTIKRMDKKSLQEFSAEFPPEIAKYLKQGITDIPLDVDKVTIFNYKKDDCEIWGEPIHACILDDLVHYDKVKLADKTTLDSIAAMIRLWKIGHLDGEYSIFPSDAAYEKLNDVLASIPSGGGADIIWNPAITVEELSKDAYKALTPEKYKAPLAAIFLGLGVPRTTNDDNTFNNSYFGLKTMTERLNYARNMLKKFWSEEFKKIHLAFGFAGKPPVVMFDEISVANREHMLALIRDLADRNIISQEETRRIFNTDPDIEAYRVKRESKQQDGGMHPPKAGPYHNANLPGELKKIGFQKGVVKPKDVGVQSTLSDKQVMSIVKPQPKGVVGKGRPTNSKDKKLRKKKVVKPRSAMASIWYTDAQKKIHDIILAKSLEKNGKKNQRQLATAETDRLEKEKFAILYNLPFGQPINDNIINGVSNIVSEDVTNKYNLLTASFVKTFGRQPNIDEQRLLQIEVCLDK